MDWKKATRAGSPQNSLPVLCSILQCPCSPPATQLGIKTLTERYFSNAEKSHDENGIQKSANVEHAELFIYFCFPHTFVSIQEIQLAEKIHDCKDTDTHTICVIVLQM